MAGLGINVNVGTSGSPKGENTTKNIEKYLKQISTVLQKSTTLSRAGYGGGGIMSLITKSGPLSALASLFGAGAIDQSSPQKGAGSFGVPMGGMAYEQFLNQQGGAYSYSNVVVGKDRESMIAKIDEKTGEIVDLLTLEEAQKKEIIDSNGKVKQHLLSNAKILEDLEDLYGLYQGEIALTKTAQEEITKLNDNQRAIIQEINELLAKERDAIRKRVEGMGVNVDESRFTRVRSGSSVLGLRDEVAKQSVGVHIANQRSYIENAFKESDSAKISNANRSLSSGVPYLDFLNSMKEGLR